MRYNKETRKVCKRVNISDLSERLNKLSKSGWSIRDIVWHSPWLCSVVANRTVMVRNPKGAYAFRS